MEKKVHIMLFDPEGKLVDERLINQDSEFYKGPILQHDGPFRLGITFKDKGDVDKAITYIQQLVGTLPLTSKAIKKFLKKEPDTPEYREQMVEEVKAASNDQDQLIKYLRDKGFVFTTWEYIQTLEYAEKVEMKEQHGSKYQWMIKRLKIAKNPSADKYDLMLLFGIILIGERSPKVIVYLNGFHTANLNIPIPDKPRETIKKTELMKFPAAMISEERDRFRYELRQLQMNPEKKITKFFKRWREFIENCPAIPQDKKSQE